MVTENSATQSTNATIAISPILPLFAVDRAQNASVVAYYSYYDAERVPLFNEQTKVLPHVDVIKRIFWALTPVFIIFGWMNLFKLVKEFVLAKNKNLDKIFNLGVNFLSVVGSTAAMFLLLTAFSFVAYYIVGAVLGVSMLHGLYNVATKMYDYFTTDNETEKSSTLKGIGLDILGIITNAFSFVANILFFQALGVFDNWRQYVGSVASQGVARVFAPAKKLLDLALGFSIAATVTAFLGFIPQAMKLNEESVEILTGNKTRPTVEERYLNAMSDIVVKIFNPNAPFWKRVGLGITACGTIPAIAAAALVNMIVVRPVCLLLVGIPQFIAKLFTKDEPAVVAKKVEDANEKQAEKDELIKDVNEKVQKLEAQPASEKRSHKISYLKGLLFVLGAGEDTSTESKLYACRTVLDVEQNLDAKGEKQYYQSLFSKKGEVERLGDRAKRFDNTAPAAKSLYFS